MTAWQTCVQPCCNNVNTERKWNRNYSQCFDYFTVMNTFVFCLQHAVTNNQVQNQINWQYGSIPAQHGMRCIVQIYVEQFHWRTNIHYNEQQRHNDSWNSQEFPNYSDTTIFMHIMQIIWQYNHNAPGGYPYEEGQMTDVHPPGDVSAHTGYGKTLCHLIDICCKAYSNDSQQEDNPRPIRLTGSFY